MNAVLKVEWIYGLGSIVSCYLFNILLYFIMMGSPWYIVTGWSDSSAERVNMNV